jgi:hypothetical protein
MEPCICGINYIYRVLNDDIVRDVFYALATLQVGGYEGVGYITPPQALKLTYLSLILMSHPQTQPTLKIRGQSNFGPSEEWQSPCFPLVDLLLFLTFLRFVLFDRITERE